MAQQVKFYSIAATDAKPDNPNGIIFVNNGELYKGTQRFGANKVYTEKPAGNTGAISGDMYVNAGVTEVFNGDDWVGITDANKWTSSSYGGTGKYIQSVQQGKDGTVTATAVDFPAYTATAKTEDATSGGITVSVTTENGQVKTVELDADEINCTSVTATSGTFTNLDVTGTAEFAATTVTADSLTVNGSTIEQLADKQIAAIPAVTKSSTANGLTVSVTTEKGSVTAVTVDATAFANVMSFRGVEASTADVDDPEAGDIVIIGASPTGSAVTGQEYIYNGNAWELIGDQSTYALKSTVDAALATKASIGTGTATASYGVSGNVVLTANAKPTMSISVAPVTTSAGITDAATTSLATAAAIAEYVTAKIDDSIPGTSKASGDDKGIQVTVNTDAGSVTQVDVAVTAVTTSEGITTGANESLVTAGAVADYVADAITNAEPLAASATDTDAGITVTVSTNAGAVSSVDVAVAKTTLFGDLDATVSSSAKGIEYSVTETDGKLTAASLSVTLAESITTSATNDQIPSAKAVSDALCWCNASGGIIA